LLKQNKQQQESPWDLRHITGYFLFVSPSEMSFAQMHTVMTKETIF